MLSLLPVVKQQFSDADGAPLVGGKLYSYIAGTTTPMTTYQDKNGSTPNTNPIVLDSGGWAPSIYIGTAAYKVILKDADDVTIWTVDNVRAPSTGDSSDETPAGWTSHVIENDNVVVVLEGETLDTDTYTQVKFEVGIVRGTDVVASGEIAIQNKGGTPRVVEGASLSLEDHGITWGTDVDDNIVTLTVQASTTLPDLTLHLRRTLIP